MWCKKQPKWRSSLCPLSAGHVLSGDFLDPWLFYERKAVVSIHLCFSPEISLDPRGLFGLLAMPTKQQL